MVERVGAAPAVLVVDDHAANLLAVEAVLASLPCRLVTARSGAEALERSRVGDYFLILMDVHMPGMDGYRTVELLRDSERTRDIPVIFVTARYDSTEHVHRGYALGALDYLLKPFDPEVLRGKVRALLSMHLRAERAERERQERAERAKALFFGAIGHDLRNPLSTIAMAAELTLRDAEGGRPAQVGHTRRMVRASSRMKGIIQDILDLTTEEFTGAIALSVQETSLREICQAIVEETRLGHPEREVRLDVAAGAKGQWDPARIARVVANLVGNAVDHSGGAPVFVRARDEGDEVALEVRNRGAPIDAERLPSIFDPFQRGDASAGVGLGLYIVREIVRAHHGTVAVTSTLSEGTTFTVKLPKVSFDAAARAH
jgi:signal transduction histidine kinase